MHPAQQLDDWRLWAHHNPAKCPCKGGGWLASDWDSWHRCGLHGVGVPHPEDESAAPNTASNCLARASHKRNYMRAAWRHFCRLSGMHPKAFLRKAAKRLAGLANPTMQEWVNAAEEVGEAAARERSEAEARRMGYTCDLERRWADEAAQERAMRMGFH